MDLNGVSSGVHKRKLKRRVGRGIGSGQGKTAGLGHKGQYASAGARLPSGLFEGGQMPLYRRWPKRGFSHATWDTKDIIVNVGDIDAVFDAGVVVDMVGPEADLTGYRLVLVPTLYLTAFVWENLMIQQPSVTRQVLLGLLLIAVMTIRPQGLFGQAKVEVV